jgi:hypothetical protein
MKNQIKSGSCAGTKPEQAIGKGFGERVRVRQDFPKRDIFSLAVQVLFISIMLSLSSCYYDKEEALYGAGPACDTTGVTYSSHINSILNNNGCVGCHSGASPSGNINLQGYTNVKNLAVTGRLYGAVSHSPGFSPMPQGGNKISNCEISRLKAWIDAGAPNN